VPRILLLGGTSEASGLARALLGDDRFETTLSLAGVTRAPVHPEMRVRIGGFGGASGLAAWLREASVALVVDATHPYATQISANAAAACADCAVPLLRIERPPWQPGPGDRWMVVPDMEAAGDHLGAVPRRVFLTVGRKDLAPFRDRPWHHYVLRSVDPPPPELRPAGATILTARGPFDLPGEMALMQAHGIELLVTKNSGGEATVAKLAAARALGVPVVMTDRPHMAAAPGVAVVPRWQDALGWLAAHAGLGDAAHHPGGTERRV